MEISPTYKIIFLGYLLNLLRFTIPLFIITGATDFKYAPDETLIRFFHSCGVDLEIYICSQFFGGLIIKMLIFLL